MWHFFQNYLTYAIVFFEILKKEVTLNSISKIKLLFQLIKNLRKVELILKQKEEGK